MIQLTREQWLTEAAGLIYEDVLQDITPEYDAPKYRVSVAPLPKRVLGRCHTQEQSKDGTNEIFITAHHDDSMDILATLTHELIHAIDNCHSGHLNFFAKTARKAGLVGKLTSTHAGDELQIILTEYHQILGDLPHATLTTKPKQKGRNNNKMTCSFCGFKANMSKKWAWEVQDTIDTLGPKKCPACTIGHIKITFN